MDEKEVQKLLDGLDIRLALGEIDLESYNRLRSKFLAGERRPARADVLGRTVDALPRKVQKLNCPNCGAPVNAEDEKVESVTCDFCGISYLLKTAEDEMERLRSDLRKWISNIAVSEGGSRSSIDEASRRFIFQEKILPQIDLEVSRTIEIFEITKHQAIIDVPLARVIPYTPFKQTLEGIPVMEDFGDRLAEILSKVQSDDIEEFALDPSDMERLGIIQIRCQELIHIQNIRNQFRSITRDSLRIAVVNFNALIDLYSTSLEKMKKGSSDHIFYSSLKKRMMALREMSGIMIDLLYKPGSMDLSQAGAMLDDIRIKLESLVKTVNSSGKEHREIIPLAEGIRSDIGSIMVIRESIDIYNGNFKGSDEGYPEFLTDLEQLISESTDRSGGMIWLLNILEILRSHTGTVHGKDRVPIVKDVSWINAMIHRNIRSSFLGGKERAEIETWFYSPFWVSAIAFSKQKGLIFKQGFSDKGLILLPAINNNYNPIRIEDESPLFTHCQNSIEKPQIIGKKPISLLPLIDKTTAYKKMEIYKNGSPDIRSGYLKMLGIIYLPAYEVKFTKKKRRILTLFGDESVYMGRIPIQGFKLGSRKVFISK